MADKSRTIDWEKFYNKELIDPIFSYIRENKDKYFLAFRDGRITIYYKKRVLVTLKPESKDEWIIYRRDKFSPRKTSPLKTDLDDLNKKFKENLKSIGFGRGDHWIMDLDKSKSGKYAELIDLTKNIIDEYLKVRFNGDETEETIQCDLACKYQDVKSGFLCIDTEFEQPDRNEANIKGRYDFIFLKKDNGTDKYKLVFVELKSQTDACKGSSGIIDHYIDMEKYLKNFNKKKSAVREIMEEGVKFAVKTKKALGLIHSDIDEEKDIDFFNPEFRFLFKMVDGEGKIMTLKDIKDLIADDIKETEEKYGRRKTNKIIKYVFENSYYDDFYEILRTKTLESSRLILRKFTLDDAEGMYNNWESDPECCKYLSWDIAKSIAETKALLRSWVSSYENGALNWVVELKETSEIIGSISVVTLNKKHSTAELGYCYGSKFWGNGYATEALRTVIEYLLNDCGIYIVEAGHISGNPVSGRVMEKAGMRKDGVLRSRRINKHTKERNDIVIYSIIKDEL